MKSALVFLSVVIIGIKIQNTTASEDLVEIKKIPGTGLYTGILYTIGMKSFPNGTVTFTNKKVKAKDANYLQIDMNPANLPYYKHGQKWENQSQWYFESSEEEGYYNLKNKGITNGILTLRKESPLDGSNFLIVARKPELISKLSKIHNSLRKDTLLKPVKIEESDRMYQLKFQSHPDGDVSYTDFKYGKYSFYIELNEYDAEKSFYKKGEKWYNDTQFEFVPTSQVTRVDPVSNDDEDANEKE